MISIDAAFAVQDHQDHLRLAEARRAAAEAAPRRPHWPKRLGFIVVANFGRAASGDA